MLASGTLTSSPTAKQPGANPPCIARQLEHLTHKMLHEAHSRCIVGADKGLDRGKEEVWLGHKLPSHYHFPLKTVAERAGFEPALGINLNTLSRRAT